jgi:hypothetical protein
LHEHAESVWHIVSIQNDILGTMGRKVVVDVTEIGRRGGLATAANRTAKEKTT